MLDRTCLAPHAVARWAATSPDALALQHVDGDTLTYRELDAEGRRWGAAFAASGIAEGDHVATMLRNDFDSHRTLLGLSWLRAVEVPIN
ncbi:MAG: carnitine-CoA ligase, partial [Actinomycetota bacterium]|nr:carnitine-CoA ligase [Actinomycetota bacterium]